jgi:hypothetical protein
MDKRTIINRFIRAKPELAEIIPTSMGRIRTRRVSFGCHPPLMGIECVKCTVYALIPVGTEGWECMSFEANSLADVQQRKAWYKMDSPILVVIEMRDTATKPPTYYKQFYLRTI